MAAQAPRDPVLGRPVDRQPSAMHDLADNGFEGLAAQRHQRHAGQLGIELVAGDETVPGVIKGEGVGGKPDRFLQPGELMPRAR